MRVISGKLKGIRFSPPKGFPSRPTTDFAKEGLFNFLGNRLNFEDIEVLDLFAGTGNISFEFASRGTKQVFSVDRNYKCIQFINSMITKHNLNNISTTKMEVTSFIKGTNSQFDLVFADPPFDYLEYHNLIKDVF
jgi:16S rRNA (guanine966-N2)-methyltransferase